MSSQPTPPLPVLGGLSISATFVTPDGERKITFSLTKVPSATFVTWTIAFALYKKQADGTFGEPVISLDVQVSPALQTQAQNVLDKGLSPSQAAYAMGPAADAAQALADGTMSRPGANRSIQNTIK